MIPPAMKPFPLLTSLLLFSVVPMQGAAVAKGDFFAVTAVKPMMELPESYPHTLRDAMAELERNMPAEELAKIDAMKSADEMAAYQRELGPLIRIRWGLGEERAERNVAHDLREKASFAHLTCRPRSCMRSGVTSTGEILPVRSRSGWSGIRR